MVEHVKKIVQLDPKLSIEERNLLSVAYKSVVGANRASWRIIATIEHKEAARSNSQSENHDDGGDDLECSPYLKDIQDYRKKVEGELEIISRDILGLLDGALIPAAESDESRVFYLKLYHCRLCLPMLVCCCRKGDYLRYMAEFMAGSAKKAVSDAALAAYESATDAALTSLSPTLPIRLGLALNFSVFHYEIMADAAAACRLARQAFDEALVHIDGLSEEAYKDSTLIMQLLRDNLSLWTAEAQELGKKTDEAAK